MSVFQMCFWLHVWLRMCVSAFACVCVCIRVCGHVHACACPHTHACLDACLRARVCMDMRVWLHVCVCMSVCMYADSVRVYACDYVLACLRACVCACLRAHMCVLMCARVSGCVSACSWGPYLVLRGSGGPLPWSFFTRSSLLRRSTSRSFPREPLRWRAPEPSWGTTRTL